MKAIQNGNGRTRQQNRRRRAQALERAQRERAQRKRARRERARRERARRAAEVEAKRAAEAEAKRLAEEERNAEIRTIIDCREVAPKLDFNVTPRGPRYDIRFRDETEKDVGSMTIEIEAEMKSWQDIIYKPSFKIKNDDKPSIPDEANVNKVSAENRELNYIDYPMRIIEWLYMILII